MKRFFIIISLFFIGSLFGQQKCSCDEALQNLVKRIESDYPGFKEKTKDTVVYNSFKRQLKGDSNSVENSSCLGILKKYTSFFKDSHIWLSPVIKLDQKGLATSEFIDVNLKDFFNNSKSKKNSIEGIWEFSPLDKNGIDYRVGIVKTKNDGYTGFAIPSKFENTKSQRVLFKLSSNSKYESFFPDKIKHTGNVEIFDNTFLYFDKMRRTLVKENQNLKISEKQVRKKIGEIQGFTIKPLSKQTTLITIPSFDYPYVEIINNLIQENQILIENSEYLIIDIRGNSGGTDNAYEKLLPYVMTNSIRWPGVEFLSTQTLIDGLEYYITTIKDKNEQKDEIEKVRGWIKLYKENMGQFVNKENNSYRTEEVSFAAKSAKYVAILTNKEVGSAAENFLIAAKQSKKVKIIGTPTYGVLDYGAIRKFDFDCQEYELRLPGYRSLRLPDYPIDNIGIQPDIYLDKSVTDLVKFAKEYLEN